MTNKFKIGDRAVYQAGSTWSRYEDHGEVIKATATTVTVKNSYGHENVLRKYRGRDGWPCRLITEYEAALLAWDETKPTLKRLALRAPMGRPHTGLVHTDYRIDIADQRHNDTVKTITELEHELELIREWFSARPAKPAITTKSLY